MTTMILVWLCMAVPMFFWGGGCPCCGGGEPDCVCEGDPATTECWEFAFAVVWTGRNPCTTAQCNQYNGTYILSRVSPCVWESSEFNAPSGPLLNDCSGPVKWVLTLGTGTSLLRLVRASDGNLIFGGSGTNPAQFFDCDGDEDFEIVHNTVRCRGAVTTTTLVTLTPITCP